MLLFQFWYQASYLSTILEKMKQAQKKSFERYLYLSTFFLSWLGILPEGLVHELPTADKYSEQVGPTVTDGIDDDLEELQRQLDALNSS